MSSGPVGPASRWAASVNVNGVYKGREGSERRERGTKSQIGGRGRREWNGGGAQAPLAREEGLNICTGFLSSYRYATADGAGLPIIIVIIIIVIIIIVINIFNVA